MEQRLLVDVYNGLVAFGGLFAGALLLLQAQPRRAAIAVLVGLIALADVQFWQVAQAAQLTTPLLSLLDFAGVIAAACVLACTVAEPFALRKTARFDGIMTTAVAYLLCCCSYWLLLPSQSPALMAALQLSSSDAKGFAVLFGVAIAVMVAFGWWNIRRRRAGFSDHWGGLVTLLTVYLAVYLLAT